MTSSERSHRAAVGSGLVGVDVTEERDDWHRSFGAPTVCSGWIPRSAVERLD